MIIDFHTHLFQESICKNRDHFFDDYHFNLLYNNQNSKLINQKTMLSAISESLIDYAVAMGFPWISEKYCEAQNQYFQSLLQISHGKILPFGSVPFQSLDNISSWVKDIKEKGLYGVGEVAFYSEGMTEFNKEYLKRIIEASADHSLPVCIHLNEPIGHSYQGKYDPELSEIYKIIKDYPDAVIILSHWGGGILFYELMPEVKKSLSNVYYDTAASPYIYDDAIYTNAISIVGSEKILLGSDYPLIQFNRYIKSIHQLIKEQEDIDNILFRNAQTILKL